MSKQANPLAAPQLELPVASGAVAVPDPRTERVSSNPWLVLLSTGMAVFAVFLDTTILFVAFAAIGADYADVSTASLSWILNAYTIAFAAMLIPAGRLADRIGRRKTFMGAVVVFTIASMLCGAATSVNVLVFARVLQALGAAALVPSSLALILQTFPRSKIPMAVAIWGAVGAVAGAVGPTLGALVVQHAGWRWAFFINLPVGLFSLLLGRRVLPEGREAKPGRFPDPLAILLLVGGLGSLAYAIVQTEEWGWSSSLFLTTFALSLLAIVGFVLRCAAVDNPLFDLKLFRAPSFRWANLAMLVFSIGFSAMFLGNVLFFTRVWHYSIVQAGLAVSAGPLIVATTAPLFGRLAGRIGQRRLLIPGGLVWASGGLFLLSQVTSAPDYLASYLPAVLLTGLGVSLCLPQLSSVSVQGLPADSFGSGSAVNQAVRNLGSTVGVALVIAFTSATAAPIAMDGFRHVWWLLVASGALVTTLSMLLPRPSAAHAT
jgi:EmrB/QacA subfamily drug resistance transporter